MSWGHNRTMAECNSNKKKFLYAFSPEHGNGPRREKTSLRGFDNNKCPDQPAHPRSLISTFVIRVLEGTISRLATSEISIF